MTCPDCERYKQSAANWRNKAYEAAGHPLPWKPDELWQGLTKEEIKECERKSMVNGALPFEQRWFFARAIEAKLKEKNDA
jgi:hypothetical protein